jgi:hypothetical protein
VRLGLLAGFGLLLLLLMIEPRRPPEPRPPTPRPAPVEIALPAGARPPAPPMGVGLGGPPPAVPRGAEPTAPVDAASIGQAPVAAAVEQAASPSGAPPAARPDGPEPDPRERLVGALAPLPAPPAVARPATRTAPAPLELVRPVPIAFPGPVARRPAETLPAVAVILDDLGLSGPATRRAIRLPAPLTLAFLPYGELVADLAREARAAGHEVFLHLAMEPVGQEDPGPMALLSALGADELRRRLHWALGRVPGAVGVNNHMGSRLTADPRAMAVVMGELAQLGLPFVDSMTTGASIAGRVALEGGVPATARDVFLDNEPTASAILAQLERAERLARRSGSAVAIGHPYPATLQVLAEWLPRAAERGLRLVPATATIQLRGCAGELAARGGCLLRAATSPDGGESLPGCASSGC